nr:hypothetical protein [Xanthomonas phaseoli]
MSFNTEKHSRSITLTCPTCAGTQFEYDEAETSGEAPMKCAGCERVLTRDELEEANAANISEHLKEFKRDMGSPPFSRTLTRRPIKAMRSVHVKAQEVHCRVQAWRG